VPLALLVLALAFATGALAQPRHDFSVPDQNATVVLVVDVSGSMRANDVEPSRLLAAVDAMRTFLDRLPKQFKVGLVAFSSEPEPLANPTTNREQLKEALGYLQPEAGTAIGDGLEVAIKMIDGSLKRAGYVRKPGQRLPAAIVLLSDGAQNRGVLQPLQAASNAKKAGIRVYTVALGTDHGVLPAGAFGTFGFQGGGGARGFPVKPDPAILAAISKDTGGRTFRAKSASSVDSIYRALGASIAHRTVTREVTSWFVGAAALLCLLSLGAARLTAGRLP
jgi:Ca-activated chloride channel family protein